MWAFFIILFSISFYFAASPEPAKSSSAVTSLKTFLDTNPKSLTALKDKDFTTLPLSKLDAVTARKLLWNAHASIIKSDRQKEIKDRILKENNLEMPFDFKTFGKKPDKGWSLWISLHGGGGAPKQVNDSQWNNQKKLYSLDEGIYLSPRAPTNTWNLWHEPHIDRFFNRLIEDLIVLEEVNPERVYILGYSAGGDGVYQLAPRMADHWAAAAMMAGHPNGVSLLSLRNLPFALQVGENDSAYNRNKVGSEYADQLKQLHKLDQNGYQNFSKIHPGKGHWMNLEDKEALPWMAKFSRNSLPDKIVWKQSGPPNDRFYWLACPIQNVNSGSLVTASRNKQQINIDSTEKISKLIVRLDDRMLDLDSPVIINYLGKEIYKSIPPRTIMTMLNTLLGRGDPTLMFDAEVSLDIPNAK